MSRRQPPAFEEGALLRDICSLSYTGDPRQVVVEARPSDLGSSRCHLGVISGDLG